MVVVDEPECTFGVWVIYERFRTTVEICGWAVDVQISR
jgi:hypothetical protein